MRSAFRARIKRRGLCPLYLDIWSEKRKLFQKFLSRHWPELCNVASPISKKIGKMSVCVFQLYSREEKEEESWECCVRIKNNTRERVVDTFGLWVVCKFNSQTLPIIDAERWRKVSVKESKTNFPWNNFYNTFQFILKCLKLQWKIPNNQWPSQ